MTWLLRVTGLRRPAPLPEPLSLPQPSATPAEPEPPGTGLYRVPEPRDPLAPCSHLGGHLLGPDGECWYCGDVA